MKLSRHGNSCHKVFFFFVYMYIHDFFFYYEDSFVLFSHNNDYISIDYRCDDGLSNIINLRG